MQNQIASDSIYRPMLLIETALLASLLFISCSESTPTEAILNAAVPLHLEDHLDVASVEGSEVPKDIPKPVQWRFDQPQPDWKSMKPRADEWEAAQLEQVDGVLRVSLSEKNRADGRRLIGSFYVDLPDWNIEDWGAIEIRARTRDRMGYLGLQFNYSETDAASISYPWYSRGDRTPLFTDGTVQTYKLSLNSWRMRRWDGPWTQLAIWVNTQNNEETELPAEERATIDIVSVTVIPREAEYTAQRAGSRMVRRRGTGDSVLDAPYRRSLYMHTPGSIAYEVQPPAGGRLDFGLGALHRSGGVTFTITAKTRGGRIETLFEENYADPSSWGERSVDLSHLTGQSVTLAFKVEAARPGTVALWSAPIISGRRTTDMPNVIFYVIDGGGSDYMSAYGYNRRTTPNLERIAAEGALFEVAYSNASWTRPSTVSFLTSLHHSVLGGLKNGRNPAPANVLTLAEHLRLAGYQMAELTTNANAGRMSNLERGHDVFRETGVKHDSKSSIELHENFWRWRAAYPGEPYGVHFQTTDVHGPHDSSPPFAGLYISPERRRVLKEWEKKIDEAPQGEDAIWGGSFEQSGVNRVDYAKANRDLYDETMAHQDYQLGRLVDRLKAAGEWDRTLLIVAADHGAAAGSQDWGVLMVEDAPPAIDFVDRGTPIFRSGVSRIPMIFVWPGRIEPGQRFSQPVSMIDMLPTILDLVDLPMPEAMQGQSLAPLLLGKEGWEPRPVILDEFEVDRETGEFSGRIEVVDGRWGASLEINPAPDPKKEADRRPAPLILYDLWNDPMCLNNLHDERPDLVSKYTKFLEAQWEAHQALAKKFTPSGESPMTPEQLETLRSLGYLR